MKTLLVIDHQKAIEVILSEIYFNEFEVIDGYNCHPQGINFYQWLYGKKLITAENLSEFQAEIKENQEDDEDFESEEIDPFIW